MSKGSRKRAKAEKQKLKNNSPNAMRRKNYAGMAASGELGKKEKKRRVSEMPDDSSGGTLREESLPIYVRVFVPNVGYESVVRGSYKHNMYGEAREP